MTRKIKLLLFLVFICALGLRVGYVLTLKDEVRYPDSESYINAIDNLFPAKKMMSGEVVKITRTPVYPLLLATSFSLFGKTFLPIRLLQALVGACLSVLVFFTFVQMFKSEVWGLAAAGVTAVYPFFIFFSGLVLTETIFTFLLLAIVYFLVRMQDEHNWKLAVLVGLLGGFTVLLKPSILLFFPFLIVVWLITARKKLKALAFYGVMIACVAVAIIPWIARNYILTKGHIVVTTLLSGKSLYESVGPQADGGPGMEKVNAVEPPEVGKMTPYAQNQYYIKKSTEAVKSDPGRFFKLAGVKFLRFWNIVPNTSDYNKPPYNWISIVSFAPILVLSIIGFFWHIRLWRKTLILVWPVVYFTGLHMVFVGSIRYRIPIEPLLIILAAAVFAGSRKDEVFQKEV